MDKKEIEREREDIGLKVDEKREKKRKERERNALLHVFR